jgi:pyruvate dehydrogenase E2 component (dihydrolipoyllysine-residue acetyltransferase)
MPQMGESIAEGTVSKWLKQVGEAVERDEPILEISTDKVDAEIPSPQAGTLVEIIVQEGETVEVGTVVAYIDTEAGAAVTRPTPTPVEPATAPAEPAAAAPEPPAEVPVAPAAPPAVPALAPTPEPAMPPVAPSAGPEGSPTPADSGIATAEERLRRRSTPVVRRIAAEHGIEILSIPGSGHAGRVTKTDILSFIESGGAAAPATAAAPAPVEAATAPAPEPAAPEAPEAPAAPSTPPAEAPAAAATPLAAAAPAPATGVPMSTSELWSTFYGEVQHPEFPVREGDEVEPMDKIRRLTAEHMVVAKRIMPHVHSFIEIDFSQIDEIRGANKAEWAKQGARVSYTAFVA